MHVSTPDILGTRAQTLAKQMGVPIVASMHTLFETYLEYYGLGFARPLAEAHCDGFIAVPIMWWRRRRPSSTRSSLCGATGL